MYFQLFKPLQCEGPYMYFQFVTGELFPCFPWDFGPNGSTHGIFQAAPAMQVTQPTPSDPAEGAWGLSGHCIANSNNAMFEGKIP